METDKIAKALVGFQADMENVTKDATNPFFKSKYATLEAILTAAKPHLKAHGLAVVQLPVFDGLRTMIIHESGQFIQADANLKYAKEDPQGQGSAITYLRRYSLCAALGIATEDDDGNSATYKSATEPLKMGAPSWIVAKPTPTAPQKAAKMKAPTTPEFDPEASLMKMKKQKVVNLLKELGEKASTKKECEDAVFTHTSFILNDDNLTDIIGILTAQANKAYLNRQNT